MANRFVFLLSWSLIAVMVLFSFSMVRKKKRKEGQLAFLKNLPSNIRNNLPILRNTPSVFIAFHPDCEHCQYEAKSICEKHKVLEKTQIIWFTNEKDSLTSVFAHTHGLDTLKNVKVISDEKKEMHTVFGVKNIPTIFIYDADGKFLKRYNGETQIDAILKTLSLQ